MQNMDEEKRAEIVDKIYRAPAGTVSSSVAPARSGMTRSRALARLAERRGAA